MVRLTAEHRINVIVNAILEVANTLGVSEVTHDAVADSCVAETTRHTVKHYFPKKDDLYGVICENGDKLNEKAKTEAKSMGLI